MSYYKKKPFLVAALIFFTTYGSSHGHNDVQARNLLSGQRCGTQHPTEEERLFIEADVKRYRATSAQYRSMNEVITIDVYWHVIIDTNGNGDYRDETIEKAIQVLNDSYGGVESSYSACITRDSGHLFSYESFPASPFKFVLKDVTRERNTEAFNIDTLESRDYRLARRLGDCSDLNIFTGNSQFLGFAFLPHACPLLGNYKNPSKQDAVIIQYKTLPEGELTPYNEGDTLVHEVGHWLGLQHTFSGCDSCDNCGDDVTDTPMERSSAQGCPIGRDTCSGGEGDDPIHNFMDYTNDCCMYRFTQGQIDRMVDQAAMYRGFKPDQATSEPTDAPSTIPTDGPSSVPSAMPSELPSSAPTDAPTITPSFVPSDLPTCVPTDAPTNVFSTVPTDAPTNVPSALPTNDPSSAPSAILSDAPTNAPSTLPTNKPTSTHSSVPSEIPSSSLGPTDTPLFTSSASSALDSIFFQVVPKMFNTLFSFALLNVCVGVIMMYY